MDKKSPRDHRGQPMPLYSATDAKNAFGAVLEDAAKYGAVGITKHDKPRFVVLSVDEYASLQPQTLPQLETEFDQLVERMQTPGATAAWDTLMAADTNELARHALVSPAKRVTKRKAAKAKRPTAKKQRRA